MLTVDLSHPRSGSHPLPLLELQQSSQKPQLVIFSASPAALVLALPVSAQTLIFHPLLFVSNSSLCAPTHTCCSAQRCRQGRFKHSSTHASPTHSKWFTNQVELSGYYEAENTTPSLEGYFCFNPASSVVGNQGDPFRKVFMPLIYLLMFVLGTLGNALVLVILERFKRSRTTTENFLFHLTLANLALLFTFPFSVVESLAGWVFGKFLCKILSAVHKINFYCSSMLLGCIAVDRYLAIVYAIHTYRKRRARSIHLTCTAVWLCSLLLTLPDLIFMEVWTDDSNRSICYFPEVGIDGNNAWLATRFLYHTVGFFVPLLVMCYCYMAIIRALCQSQRLQRQKAVRVAILVTGIFLLCWSPYHIVIFLNTLTKLEAFTKNCHLEDQLDTAIMVTEAIGFTHCCLNPILYAFIGVKFRNDFFRILQELGCISQETLQEILEVTRKGSGIDSDNTTSISTF
ncbi:C-X-C chemokine receptor type 5 isoform X2 [Passer montanus]|uniref:C-X-C chemokine receptor type 5 isoform X2 n=1 Tax=Passer montanus TaxID=9160 RepID=UPI00195F7A1F|nr:C-X-C chemokine receptor type 5 isoform X2 [Passer montanus]